MQSIANEMRFNQVTAKGTVFRLVFVTPHIEPVELPKFSYQAHQLNHDTIEFVALVAEATLDGAMASVKAHWPESSFTQAEVAPGGSTLVTSSLLAHVMGILPPMPAPPRKRGLLYRMWVYVAGEGPLFPKEPQ